ncbi:MAG: hypothetical protein M8364_10660 [Methylobacter sp.]|uniref:hypothetical protein n=1 Tax=Methylobacter sp. TaxID=2051955 RepID=UPI0025897E9B|nr:hypothetical protein [Methylobacter sp.]MCL7421350.1 hypothetical protein [Methylobacter sp.]
MKYLNFLSHPQKRNLLKVLPSKFLQSKSFTLKAYANFMIQACGNRQIPLAARLALDNHENDFSG